MTLSLGSGLFVAVVIARLILPKAVKLLAQHASPELYQLTLISFCLCSSWVSGYMVRVPTNTTLQSRKALDWYIGMQRLPAVWYARCLCISIIQLQPGYGT